MDREKCYRWLHKEEYFTQPQPVFRVDKQKYQTAIPVYSTVSINAGRE